MAGAGIHALGRFLRTALILYLALLGALIWLSPSLIYPFANDADLRAPFGLPGIETVAVPVPGGPEALAWVVPPQPGRPMVVVFPGNVGQMAHGVAKAAPLVAEGFGAAILSYPGANGAPGRPGEGTITAAARAVLDEMRSRHPDPAPVLYGLSLGAAVALQVAATDPVGALVLEAPFPSTYAVARVHYPFIPPFPVLPHNRWDGMAAAARIEAPVLIVHGAKDSVVPTWMGERVAMALGDRARLHVVPGAGHNDLHRFGADAPVVAFLTGLFSVE